MTTLIAICHVDWHSWHCFQKFLYLLQIVEMWSCYDDVFTQYSLQKPVSTKFKYVDAIPFVLFCIVIVSIANIQKLQSWQTGTEHFLYSLLLEEGDPKPFYKASSSSSFYPIAVRMWGVHTTHDSMKQNLRKDYCVFCLNMSDISMRNWGLLQTCWIVFCDKLLQRVWHLWGMQFSVLDYYWSALNRVCFFKAKVWF